MARRFPTRIYRTYDSGGYEHDFVGEVSDKYICVICDKVMRDPRLTACCGQHFCDSCLTRWTATRRATCPHCRSENFQSILNKERIREINELRVRCSQSERGCTWEGEMGSLKGHLQSCGHVLVRCDNFGFVTDFHYDPYAHWHEQIVVSKRICDAEVERRHIEQHKEEECPYRQYRCVHCGYSDTYDAIAGTGHVTKKDSKIKNGTNHHDECLHFPLDCPNRCGVKNIKRRNMKTHREKCPQEPVECPFGGHACLGSVTRANISEHQKDCDFRPYKCDYCGKKGTFASITGEESVKFYGLLETCHYDECLEYPLVCPNGCGETFKQKEAKTHQGKCPMEHATCPFSHVGCTTKPPQRELDSHCQEEMQKHLLLMAKSHKELSEKNKQLSERNTDLAHKNEELQYLVGILSEKWERMERDISVNYMSLESQLDMLREELSQQFEELDDRVSDLVTSSSRGHYRGARGGRCRGRGGGWRRGRGPPV